MDTLAGSNIEKIDFLPIRFREQSEVRTVNVWRLLAVACFAAMVLAGAWMQQRSLKNLETELVQVTANHGVAVARTERMAIAKAQRALTQGRAELVTYLKHPWPRSQVLATIVDGLPASVVLAELRFVRRLSNGQRERIAAASMTKESTTASAAGGDPAIEDLDILRDTVGETELVEINGSTSDITALYDYLARLNGHRLVANAKIESIEREEKRPEVGLRKPTVKASARTAGSSRKPNKAAQPEPEDEPGSASFRVVIVLSDGYGQPNGPSQSPSDPMPSATSDKMAGEPNQQTSTVN
jgi:Tfp pilus assembly protein PilN